MGVLIIRMPGFKVRILKYQVTVTPVRYPSDPMISVSYPSFSEFIETDDGPNISGFFLQSYLGDNRPLSTLIFQICMVQTFLGIVNP